MESLHGFDVIEQYQTSAIRYQINFLLWGLQLAQCHYTPNFHGYLSLAQRNLIDKLDRSESLEMVEMGKSAGKFSFQCRPDRQGQYHVWWFFQRQYRHVHGQYRG